MSRDRSNGTLNSSTARTLLALCARDSATTYALEHQPPADLTQRRAEEAFAYFDKNQGFIVNYGDRYRHGDPISTGFVEFAVKQVVCKRFEQWYPSMAANESPTEKMA